MTTRTSAGLVELVNVSSTGARLRCTRLPALGQDILIKVADTEAFGTVVWVRGDQCGLNFDEPISELKLRLMQRDSQQGIRARLSPADRLAAEDWSSGYAR